MLPCPGAVRCLAAIAIVSASTAAWAEPDPDSAPVPTSAPVNAIESTIEPQRARPDETPAALTKKAQRLADKARTAPMSPLERERWHRQLAARRGKPAPAPLNIHNNWTREVLPVPAQGPVAFDQDRIDLFFRCHFTLEPTDMDPRLFQALVAAARHFGTDQIRIVSGYRAPKYNLILRKKGREVARNSQHTHGSAVDFRIPGVPVGALHAWARRQRLGGVGFYRQSGFIHMDTGPIRYWNGR
ncbi:DUF882 domain-containing protein [Haliangium sp.]|uniref:YcbK family protein n=1 Tax=Haliangium sp. TaxID=2663208 RepID=UPI003D104F30